MLTHHDASTLADLIRRRKVSSTEAVRASIDAIERLNPAINAVVTPLFERALEEAQQRDAMQAHGGPLGPLHGIPLVIKDLFDFRAGVRNTFGSRALAHFVPQETSAHIARLERAGAVIVGKSNTSEFGHQGITDNRLFGPTRNPVDLARNAGGSSGGSAAAVAAGMVPIAQGSDAGGSVRIPAAWCNVVGFKPSFGRIPNTGGGNAFASHTPFVHAGTLTRTVRDAALMAQSMIGPHPRDPFSSPDDGLDLVAAVDRAAVRSADLSRPLEGLRVGLSVDLGVFAVEPAVESVIRAAAEALASAGARVDELAFPMPYSQDELAALWRRQVGLFYAEFFAAMEAGGIAPALHEANDVAEDVREMAAYGRTATALETRRDDWVRTRVFHAFQDAFATYDLIATPTTTCLPVFNADQGVTQGPESVAGTRVERCIGWCMTHPVNFTGHPAISIPGGQTSSGLPVGLQLIGRRFMDATVLETSRVFEARRPWILG